MSHCHLALGILKIQPTYSQNVSPYFLSPALGFAGIMNSTNKKGKKGNHPRSGVRSQFRTNHILIYLQLSVCPTTGQSPFTWSVIYFYQLHDRERDRLPSSRYAMLCCLALPLTLNFQLQCSLRNGFFTSTQYETELRYPGLIFHRRHDVMP